MRSEGCLVDIDIYSLWLWWFRLEFMWFCMDVVNSFVTVSLLKGWRAKE